MRAGRFDAEPCVLDPLGDFMILFGVVELGVGSGDLLDMGEVDMDAVDRAKASSCLMSSNSSWSSWLNSCFTPSVAISGAVSRRRPDRSIK